MSLHFRSLELVTKAHARRGRARAGSHQHTTVQQPLRPSARLCGSKPAGRRSVSAEGVSGVPFARGGHPGCVRGRGATAVGGLTAADSAAPPVCGVQFEFFEIRAHTDARPQGGGEQHRASLWFICAHCASCRLVRRWCHCFGFAISCPFAYARYEPKFRGVQGRRYGLRYSVVSRWSCSGKGKMTPDSLGEIGDWCDGAKSYTDRTDTGKRYS